jgi:predicted SprT family Zn-dependent metalloprotease
VLGKAVHLRAGVVRKKIGKKHADGIEEADDEYIMAILINNRIFWQITEVGKTEIVVHETCHLIDFYLQIRDTGRIVAEHNDRWKRMMWACGFTAREYVPHSELGIEHEHKLYCSNPICNVHTNLSRTKYNRAVRGTEAVYCRPCMKKDEYWKLVPEKQAADLNEFNLDKTRSVG